MVISSLSPQSKYLIIFVLSFDTFFFLCYFIIFNKITKKKVGKFEFLFIFYFIMVNTRICEICGIRERHCKTPVLFAAFPLEQDRCRAWLKAVGNEELVYLPIEKLHHQRTVCGNHFQENDFNGNGTRLRKRAIPSLNLMNSPLTDSQLSEFPQHMYKSPRIKGKPESTDISKSTEKSQSTERPESTSRLESPDRPESTDIPECTDGENFCQTSTSVLGSTEFLALCRTCLNEEASNPIISEEMDYSEIVYMVTGIKVKIDDGLPQKLCQNCVNNINNCLDFRKQCLESETQLLKMKNIFENSERNSGIKLIKLEFDDRDEKNGMEVFTKDELDSDENSLIIDDTEKNEEGTVVVTKKNREVRHKAKLEPRLRQHFAKRADLRQVCEHCGNTFPNSTRLLQHCRVRHGYQKLRCQEAACDFQTAFSESMKTHERIHRGEKPFVCERCGAAFAARHLLRQHQRVHDARRAHQCSLCPASFHVPGGLRAHVRSQHTARRFACLACARTFHTSRALLAHARVSHRPPPLADDGDVK